MKITGVVFLVLLIAAAIVMVLRAKEVKHIQSDLARMAPRLQEEGVEGKTMRHRDALRRISEMENLCATPSLIAANVPLLRTVAEDAASWAQGSPSPSVELTAAVALRAAVVALREYAVRPSERHIATARSELLDAKSALEGFEPTTTMTDGLRDRLKNIDYSQREKLQELEEAY